MTGPHKANQTALISNRKRWLTASAVFALAGPLAGVAVAKFSSAPLVLALGVFLFWEFLGGMTLLLLKRSQDAVLRRQSLIYESVYWSMAEGVVIADPGGRLLLFNRAAERIPGIGLTHALVPDWSSTYGCFDPETQEPYPPERLPLALALRGEATQGVEILIRNPEVPAGVTISISGAPLLDEEGHLLGGVVVFHDVSAAKAAQRKLHSSLRQLEDLKRAVDEAAIVSVTDSRGVILYANDKLCEISGYSREELVGAKHWKLSPGTQWNSLCKGLWRKVSRGQTWRGELCDRSKKGDHYWLDTTIVPVLNESGRPERFFVIRTDVTERKTREQEMLRLWSAVEQTADTVFITDTAGVIQYVNPAFEATTGYSREEAIGQTPRLLKSGRQPEDYSAGLWRTVLRGQTYRATIINRKKSGELYTAEQTITPIRDAHGKIVNFVAVVKDITDRLKREAQEIEMYYASQVQRKLYPSRAPVFGSLDVAACTYPAEITSGDYYDYVRIQDGSLGLAVGDVCSHGLGSALIMAETRAYLRSTLRSLSAPGEALTAVNEMLCGDLDDNRFVTLVLACIEPSSRRLAYTNAGHSSGYHLDRSGGVKSVLESTAPPLGLFPSLRYQTSLSAPLEPGDIVALLTDGVVECENADGEPFGSEAAIRIIRESRRLPSGEIVERLYQGIREFARQNPQQDDITMLICKVDP